MRLIALLFGAFLSFAAHAQVVTGGIGQTYPTPFSSTTSVLFGQQGDSSVSPISQLFGTRGFDWAGTTPVPGVQLFTSAYIPCCRLPFQAACAGLNGTPLPAGCPSPSLPQMLAWMQTYYPSFLVYACDQVTPMADTAADKIYDIDFTSAAPRAYMAAYAAHQHNLGWPAVALDNVSPASRIISGYGSSRCGHYVGATAGCGTAPAFCGTWHQDFIGTGVEDPTYVAAMVDYINWLRNNLHGFGMALAANSSTDKTNTAGSISISLALDLAYKESVFTAACTGSNTLFIDNADGYWTAEATVAQGIAQTMPVLFSNYLCNHDEASITNSEASWIVANYLYERGPKSLLQVTNGTHTGTRDAGTFINYQSFMNPPVGSPTELPTVGAGGCMERTYSTGLVEVNPSVTLTCNYTVPGGGAHDQFGNAVAAGTYALPTSTGLVLTYP